MTYQEQLQLLQKIKQQLDEAKRLNAESRLLLGTSKGEVNKQINTRVHTGFIRHYYGTYNYIASTYPHVTAFVWLGTFLLGTAVSKAVDPKNFSEELGIQYATKDALVKAEDKLWELEGYNLYKTMQVKRLQVNAQGTLQNRSMEFL